MTREEAIRKLEYSKKAYQRLIDEKVDSGKLVGKDGKGEWKADTPLDEAYKSMIDALETAIKALKQEPGNDTVSLGVFEQVRWERDVAIDQLKQLGYELGEKIRISDDAVDRQAVLDIDFRRIILTTAKPAEMIEQKVKALPSVNPQSRIGHWIEDEYEMEVRCSECGEENDECSKYCPNCGSYNGGR